ncbi:MAG: hypothetical protein WA970_11335 [Gammaproteobacteria bacterium]
MSDVAMLAKKTLGIDTVPPRDVDDFVVIDGFLAIMAGPDFC